MKKIIVLLSISLVILFSLTLIGCDRTDPGESKNNIYQTTPKENEGFNFQLLSDGTYSVSIDDSYRSPMITLPTVHQGIPVTRFVDATSYETNIVIPDQITKIRIDELMSEGLNIYISDLASWNEKDVDLPKGTKLYVDGKRIEGHLVIPEGVTVLKDGPFDFLDNVFSITLPSTLEKIEGYYPIGRKAFAHHKLLEIINHSSLTLSPDSGAEEDSIARFAKYIHTDDELRLLYVDGLVIDEEYIIGYVGTSTDVVFPKSPSYPYFIDDDAFSVRTDITSLTFEEGSVSYIGVSAFGDCKNLTSVKFCSDIGVISSYAFAACDSLTSITIPKKTYCIGYLAFYGCDNLKEIIFEDPVNWDAIYFNTEWAPEYTREPIDLSDPAKNAEQMTSGEPSYYLENEDMISP